MGFLTNVAQKIVGTDPGAGTAKAKRLLQRALKPTLRFDGLDYHVVRQQESRSRTAYLARWANALRDPSPPRAESAARAIASHLLDLGYSSDFLHRWWKYRVRHEPGTRSIADVVEDAQRLVLAPPRSFDVMAPASRALRLTGSSPPAEWQSPEQVSAWLRLNRFDVTGLRQDGGFLFRIEASDSDAAVARVAEILDQLSARVAIGTRRGLALLGRVWIRGVSTPQRLDRTRRGVWVEALERENQLYDARSSGRLHAAIELLSHLQSSSPGAAVAGGWAAIEALLSEPGGSRVEAADRLATLVACSYPRAELTALSYSLLDGNHELAKRLQGIDENRDRCHILADALSTRALDDNGLGGSDRAAVSRTLDMLREPRKTLALVQEHATNAFRRLYRQRNMVLHGALTNAVALRASLRTAAPLVGAGIDRIIHAHYVDKLQPLPLVARAQVALATVGDCRRSRHHKPPGHGLAGINEVIGCAQDARDCAATMGRSGQPRLATIRWRTRSSRRRVFLLPSDTRGRRNDRRDLIALTGNGTGMTLAELPAVACYSRLETACGGATS